MTTDELIINKQKITDLRYFKLFLELLDYKEYNKLCIDETLVFGFKMKKEYLNKKYMVYPIIDELTENILNNFLKND